MTLLKSNELTKIPTQAFNDSLVYINCANNSLSTIENEGLDGLYVLEYGDLSINRLKAIFTHYFRNLIRLQYLNISFNPITFIHNDIFISNVDLMTLQSDWNVLCCFVNEATS